MSADSVKRDLAKLANPDKAAHFPKFFKSGKGEYGEGDKFVGVIVPNQRKVAKRYRDLPRGEIAKLVKSPFHEHRLTGFFILIDQYKKADPAGKTALYKFCLRHKKGLNNWDLVDTVAPKLIGPYMLDHPDEKATLYQYAQAKDLWKRRIAIISTLAFIREEQFGDTLAIAELLVDDSHDLIHKGVGWMLREVGNRDRATEEAFLDRHAATMPRTMLRYAIEKFSDRRRKHYMNLA